MSDFLLKAEQAINNGIKSPEISALLEPYGFDAQKMLEGQALYQETYQLYQHQKQMYKKKFEARDQLKKLFEKQKTEHFKLNHVALILSTDDPNIEIQLGLKDKRQRSFAGKAHQMDLFYQSILDDPALSERFALYNITRVDITARQELLKQVIRLKEKFDALKSEAQQATEDRNQSIEKLENWLKEYRNIARFALKEKPQYLEKLGVFVRSGAKAI